MAECEIKYTNPFPYPSSAFPMMFSNSATPQRAIQVAGHSVYSTFVPFNYRGREGVYQENPLAFDEFKNMDKNPTFYQYGFQYLLTLIGQKNVGTPYLRYDKIPQNDMKVSEFEKFLLRHNNYENNNANAGSESFNYGVTQRVAAITGLREKLAEPDTVEPKTDLGMDSAVFRAYKEQNVNIFAINSRLGSFGAFERTKFDVIFMPMYEYPDKLNFDDRGIFGFIAIFISYDPLWKMRDALTHFVRSYGDFLKAPKSSKLDFTSEPTILKAFNQNGYHDSYIGHFSEYISINPHLIKAVEKAGINLNADNANQFELFLSLDCALRHAAAYIGKSDTGTWFAEYKTIETTRHGMLTFSPRHDPYIYDYTNFQWNTNNQLGVGANLDTSGKSGKGIFHEYMPWITRYYRRESTILVGFERTPQSLLDADKVDDDVMDIDAPPPLPLPAPPVAQRFSLMADPSPIMAQLPPITARRNEVSNPKNKNKIHGRYLEMHETIMNDNTNAEDTFIHGDHNALVALAERIRGDFQKVFSDMQTYRNHYAEFDRLLFPKDPRGLASLTDREIEQINTILVGLEEKNKVLRRLQRRLLDFLEKRILTLATTKPLTPAVLAVIRYIFGRTERTGIQAGAGQSYLQVKDAKPLKERNLSQYQLRMMDPNLDITAHSAIYFATCTRYFGYNTNCTHDIYKLRVGLLDAFRSEFNLHWNYGSFGPLGTSKSRALDVVKVGMVPNTYVDVTTSSKHANSSSTDQSDRIRFMDEASDLLASNSKTPGASYSPDAARIKAELSQGFHVRQVLDPGKNFKERITRNVVSIQTGSIAATGNNLPTDDAMKSRFHMVLTESENSSSKKKSTSKSSTSSSSTSSNVTINVSGDKLLAKQNRERTKLSMTDMIVHTPSEMTKKTTEFFTESLQMEHCLGILVWKFVQVGLLRKPSKNIVCLVAVIAKYLKTALKISIGMRTINRIEYFCMSLAINTAINTLYNTPGIHEELHGKPFAFADLFKTRPYLYVTLQDVLLSFSLMSCEFIKQSDNKVMEALVEYLSMGGFPLKRVNELFKQRNIEKVREQNPLYATINAVDLSALKPEIHSDPLWDVFKSCETLPLEYFYYENAGKNIFQTFWRVIMPVDHQARKMQAQTQAPKKTQVPTKESVPINEILFNNSKPTATTTEDEMDIENEPRIDLNFWNTGLTKPQLLEKLQSQFNDRFLYDQVSSSFKDIENQKITATTSLPATKKELARLMSLAGQNVTFEDRLLPRVEREMNCLEIESGLVHINVYLLSDLLNRPGNSSIIIQAIKSFLYKGLNPRTLLTGSELSDNYDVEFNMHVISEAELAKPSVPDYLSVTDPSLIQETIDNKQRVLVDNIIKTMRDLAKTHDETTKKFNEKMNEMKSKEQRKTATNNANNVFEFNTLKEIDKTINRDKDVDFTDMADSVETAEGHQRIYADIDEWSFVNNCLENGIPMQIIRDGNQTRYEYKHNPDDVTCRWEPIRTPLRLIELHNAAGGPVEMKKITAPITATVSLGKTFLQTLVDPERKRKRKRDDDDDDNDNEKEEKRPEKRARQNTKEKVKSVIKRRRNVEDEDVEMQDLIDAENELNFTDDDEY